MSGKLCFGLFFTLLAMICKMKLNSLRFTAVLPICDPSTKSVITLQSLVIDEPNVYASHSKGTRERER